MSSVATQSSPAVKFRTNFVLPSSIISPLVAIIDILSLGCAMGVARRAYEGSFLESDAYFGLGVVSGLIFLVCARDWGLYRLPCLLAPQRSLSRLGAAAGLGTLAVVSVLFLMKTGAEFSRGAIVLFAFVSPLVIFVERSLIAVALARCVHADIVRGKRVVLLGDREELDRFTAQDSFHFGLDEIGRFALSLSQGGAELTADDKSTVRDALQFGRHHRASEYALIMPWGHDRTLSQVVDLMRLSPRAIRLYPDRKTRDIFSRKRERRFNPYFSVEIRPEPLTRLEQLAKRTFDIVVSLCALLLLSPILAIAVLLIKWDSPGPVIFRQTRWGFDDHEFKIWKFRSMTVMEDGDKIVQAQRNDARVTAVGRVLRRTSIDELPQLVNVLKGEMSIVGPRPHAVAHDVEYGALMSEYALRRHVKPGLTGLAQSHGLRGETRTQDHMMMRVQKDLWYIDNWSFWLDIKIIFQTIVMLAVNEAY